MKRPIDIPTPSLMSMILFVIACILVSAWLATAQSSEDDYFAPYKCATNGNPFAAPAGCELVIVGKWTGLKGQKYTDPCPLAEMGVNPYDMAECDALASEFLQKGMQIYVGGGLKRQALANATCLWMHNVAEMKALYPTFITDDGYFFRGMTEIPQ